MAAETYLLYGGSMGGGKSVWLNNEALTSSLRWEGNRVGLYRWENTSFTDTTYVTMDKWILQVPGLVRSHNQQKREITLVNGSVILYGGIKPGTSVSGGDPMAKLKSLEISRVYIDEVTEVPKRFYDILTTRMGRLPGKVRNKDTGVMEFPPRQLRCTCNPELGWTKGEYIDQKLPDHRFIKAQIKDNPHLPPDYEDSLRKSLPPEWVDQYIDGNWGGLSAVNALIPNHLLVWAVHNSGLIVPDWSDVSFGWDVAGEGDDRTVGIRRLGMVAEVTRVEHFANTMKSVAMICREADRTAEEMVTQHMPEIRPEDYPKAIERTAREIELRVDGVGMGSPICDRLGELGYNVIRIIGGAKTRKHYKAGWKFRNLRTEIYWDLRQLLEEHKVRLPDDYRLSNELGIIQYNRTASDRAIGVESKDDIKKRLDSSPDFADACVYAFSGILSPSSIFLL